MALKDRASLTTELEFGIQNPRSILEDIKDSVIALSGSLNLKAGIYSGSAPADPAIKNQLFLTSSAAIGGGAYDFIAVSRG